MSCAITSGYSITCRESVGGIETIYLIENANLYDASGSITTGGTAQTALAADQVQKYLIIQNVSPGDLWVNFGTAAVADSPSLAIPPGKNGLVS